MKFKQRLAFLICIDSLIVIFSIYVSNFFFYGDGNNGITKVIVISSLSLLIFHHLFAKVYGLYRKAWEYASIDEVWNIFKAISFSILSTAIVQLLVHGTIYKKILLIAWMIHLILIGGSRLGWRLIRENLLQTTNAKKNALIIGAGSGGNMIVRQLQRDDQSELNPVAFLDDDFSKQRLEILGVPVLGTISKLEKVVSEKDIQHIIIAIPSLSKLELNSIFSLCSKTNIRTQILPRLEDIAEGKIVVSQLKDVSVEDLLGRQSVELDEKKISNKLKEKVILVTGAGGSIGSEICRQIMQFNPEKLILLGHGENSIYTIEMELLETFSKNNTKIIAEIADVQDREKIFSIMEKYRPNFVYHAAAHKHVPLMEKNPDEAVKNNILGTKNVAEASDCFGIGTFVMVSTDKAVNPTNVMGATKRGAEMLVQSLNSISQTQFVAVRFGNVLGSRGSVIPRFKAQIAKGGPVTVTHPEMTRYFMTIPEASRLVIQAGVLAKGGEIFVLDMGEPVKIVDLAKNLIKLSGCTVEEIGIVYSGIRPGEKLYEELLMNEEGLDETTHKKIFIGQPTYCDLDEVVRKIEAIVDVLGDSNLVRKKLKELVTTYVEVTKKEEVKVS